MHTSSDIHIAWRWPLIVYMCMLLFAIPYCVYFFLRLPFWRAKSMSNAYNCLLNVYQMVVNADYFLFIFIHSNISNRYFFTYKKKELWKTKPDMEVCGHINQFSFLPVCVFISFFVVLLFFVHFSFITQTRFSMTHARKQTHT